MYWNQTEIVLAARPRGIHLITEEVRAALPNLREVGVGILHLFIQHTSASLSINENADPEVRRDMARWLDHAIPDGAPYFRHVDEGDDDMPAHMKASVLGAALTIPIRKGALALGTWQGVYLAEHRDAGGRRRVMATIWGDRQGT